MVTWPLDRTSWRRQNKWQTDLSDTICLDQGIFDLQTHGQIRKHSIFIHFLIFKPESDLNHETKTNVGHGISMHFVEIRGEVEIITQMSQVFVLSENEHACVYSCWCVFVCIWDFWAFEPTLECFRARVQPRCLLQTRCNMMQPAFREAEPC